MKVPVKGGANMETMALALKEHPDVRAKLPTIPNYAQTSITDGNEQNLTKAKVIRIFINVFLCSM